jgi:hypothetical protein
MFHFTVPSGMKVDDEGVTDALVCSDAAVVHVFDRETGQVVELAHVDVAGVLRNTRYFKIERLPKKITDRYARRFLNIMKKMMGPDVNARLSAIVREGGCEGLEAFFKTGDTTEIDGWDDGWWQFKADSAWEDMCAWFSRNPELGIVQVIEEKWRGVDPRDEDKPTCDCELCDIMHRQMEGEEVSIEEMHKAFLVHESMQNLEEELKKWAEKKKEA